MEVLAHLVYVGADVVEVHGAFATPEGTYTLPASQNTGTKTLRVGK